MAGGTCSPLLSLLLLRPELRGENPQFWGDGAQSTALHHSSATAPCRAAVPELPKGPGAGTAAGPVPGEPEVCSAPTDRSDLDSTRCMT